MREVLANSFDTISHPRNICFLYITIYFVVARSIFFRALRKSPDGHPAVGASTMVIILPVPHIKDCAKLWAVPPEFSHPLRNTSRKKWEIFLLSQEGKQSERVRNTAPSVRKKISAPMPNSGHKLRIARRRYCLRCEKPRVDEKEVRRKLNYQAYEESPIPLRVDLFKASQRREIAIRSSSHPQRK